MEIYCIPTISNGMDIQYPEAQQMRTASTCSDESNKRDIHTLNKHGLCHGLRTPNEGINQINLKICAALAVPKYLGLGLSFWPCSEGDFLTGRP